MMEGFERPAPNNLTLPDLPTMGWKTGGILARGTDSPDMVPVKAKINDVLAFSVAAAAERFTKGAEIIETAVLKLKIDIGQMTNKRRAETEKALDAFDARLQAALEKCEQEIRQVLLSIRENLDQLMSENDTARKKAA